MKQIRAFAMLATLLLLSGIPAGAAETWQSIGTGTYVGGLLDALYPAERGVEWAVDIEEETSTPGYYRIRPYYVSGNPTGKTISAYIKIHAENPEAVTVATFAADSYRDCVTTSPKGRVEGNKIILPAMSLMEYSLFGETETPTNTTQTAALILPGPTEETLTPIGQGTFVEGIFDVFDSGIPGRMWMVNMEESDQTPGKYRVFFINPDNATLASVYPYLIASYGEDIVDIALIVHTEEPNRVWCEDVHLYDEVNWDYRITHFYPGNPVVPADMASYMSVKNYGVLGSDRVIRWTEPESFGLYDKGDAEWDTSNKAGMAALALPGVRLIPDFSLGIDAPAISDGTKLENVTLTAGEDLARVEYTILPGHFVSSQVPANWFFFYYLNFPAGEYAELTAAQLNSTADFVFQQPLPPGKYTFLLAGFDTRSGEDTGDAQTERRFFVPHTEDADLWEDAGTATFRDAFIAPNHSDVADAQYSVTLQQSVSTQGLYRIPNPYGAHPGVTAQAAGSYIIIHAENPQKVWLEETLSGVNLGQGHITLTSDVGAQLQRGALMSDLANSSSTLWGTFDTEGNLIFPTGGLLFSRLGGDNEAYVKANAAEATLLTIPGYTGIEAETLTLDATELNLFVDDTATLLATLTPDYISNPTVVWTSSAPEVAAVDDNGQVTALSLGQAVITATCGEATATCTVTVDKHLQEILWTQMFDGAVQGDNITLTATATSGLPVSYAVTEGDATVAGDVLTITGSGMITVTATQEGDNAWMAAEPVARMFNAASGIDALDAATDADVQWIDITGRRIDEPTTGFAIRRQGSTATKVIR